MGSTKVKARIYGEDGSQDLDFTVNPDSLETVVPEDVAEKLGISMPWEKEFKTKNGDSQIKKVGDAVVEIDGISFLVFVVPGEKPALGYDALESGRFKINSKGELVRVKKAKRNESESSL